jgi:hypothetical protein
MRALWLLAGLLLLVFVYIYFYPDYRQRIGEQLRELSADAGITKKTTYVYKWRNAKGEWQLTDQPPPAGVEYERLDYREDLNVLPLPPQLGGE